MIRKYKVTDFDNYDGDSFNLTIDLGFDLVYHIKARLEGVDTPEIRGGTATSKAAAQVAKDHVRSFAEAAMEAGELYFVSETYRGKFGRPLGDLQNGEGMSLREDLIDKNMGVPYEGQAKALVQALHVKNYKALIEQGLISAEIG